MKKWNKRRGFTDKRQERITRGRPTVIDLQAQENFEQKITCNARYGKTADWKPKFESAEFTPRGQVFKINARSSYPESDWRTGWEINLKKCAVMLKEILRRAKAGVPITDLEFQFSRLFDEFQPLVYRLTHEEVFGKILRQTPISAYCPKCKKKKDVWTSSTGRHFCGSCKRTFPTRSLERN